MKIFIIDIDGTICENVRNEEGKERMKHAKPILSSMEKINHLYRAGHYICFFTARRDEHEQVTRAWLRKHGVKYHQLILNKPRKLPPYVEYHFVDDSKVKATTFKGKFTEFVKRKVDIEVFEE
ncbi:MAG: phosphoheptose isomerase [Thaumarchaeota archaeon]|nr:phosphoheptose isomerase [Nitrososphaerota archaeon]